MKTDGKQAAERRFRPTIENNLPIVLIVIGNLTASADKQQAAWPGQVTSDQLWVNY